MRENGRSEKKQFLALQLGRKRHKETQKRNVEMHFCLETNPLEQPPQTDDGNCAPFIVIYNQTGCITVESDIKNKPAANARGRTEWRRCLMSKAPFTSPLSAFQSFCVNLLIPLFWQKSNLVISFCLPYTSYCGFDLFQNSLSYLALSEV